MPARQEAASSSESGPTKTVQFSIFLANKPSMLAKVCHRIYEERVNIRAISLMDSSEHGVLRLVADDPAAVREALKSMDVAIAETEVLLMTMPNRPGAFAAVFESLSQNHVEVQYAYVTAGAPNGKTIGVFRCSDMAKAEKLLEGKKPKRKAPATARSKRGRG